MKIKKNFIKTLFIVIAISLTTPNLALSVNNIDTVEAASIKLNKTKLNLLKGKTYQLKLKNTKSKIKWTSSNKKIATVNKNGKVIAKKAGTATISAIVENKNYTCTVTVKEIKLNQTKLNLNNGDTYKLKLENNKSKISWTSSNNKIITVDKKGRIKAKKAGKATITAIAENKKYKCTVTVMEKLGSKKNPISALDLNTITFYDKYGDRYLIQLQLTDAYTGYAVDYITFGSSPPPGYKKIFMQFHIDYISGPDDILGTLLLGDENFYNSTCERPLGDLDYDYFDEDYLDVEYLDEDYLYYSDYAHLIELSDLELKPSTSADFYCIFAAHKQDFPITFKLCTGYDKITAKKTYTWFTTNTN